ncbi:MAG: phage tail protein I [Clostridia bacterium]|nr:phage tail protein I [Clostridia bacterium]
MKQITQTGSIYDVPLNQTLPPALQFDTRVVALSTAISAMLQNHADILTWTIGIYYRIEELDETMLDILAADLHADWYDYDGSIEQKRAVIKNNVAIHRKMGTVAGLKTVIESVMGTAELEEWFQYGGEPYYFRVLVNADDIIEQQLFFKLLQAIKIYKPVRAHLDKVVAHSMLETQIVTGIASQIQLKIAEKMDSFTLDDIVWLLDENENLLLDQDGNVLTIDKEVTT